MRKPFNSKYMPVMEHVFKKQDDEGITAPELFALCGKFNIKKASKNSISAYLCTQVTRGYMERVKSTYPRQYFFSHKGKEAMKKWIKAKGTPITVPVDPHRIIRVEKQPVSKIDPTPPKRTPRDLDYRDLGRGIVAQMDFLKGEIQKLAGQEEANATLKKQIEVLKGMIDDKNKQIETLNKRLSQANGKSGRTFKLKDVYRESART